MVARTEYFDAINESDSALAERVRSLRDEAKKLVRVRKTAKLTIEKARDQIAAKEQRLEVTRSTLESREGALLSARATRRQALNSVQGARDAHEEIAAGLRSEIAQEIAEATGGMPLPAGPLPSPERRRVHLAGRRHPHLRLRLPLGPDARGDRHLRAGRDADPRRGRRHRDPRAVRVRKRRLRQLHLHRPRRRALHLLRPPVELRDLGRRPGSARAT